MRKALVRNEVRKSASDPLLISKAYVFEQVRKSGATNK